MSSLHLDFENGSGKDIASVYVGFVPGASNTAFSIVNSKTGQPMASVYAGLGTTNGDSGNWYELGDLSAGVDIASFSGRVYICYDTPWTPQHDGYEPGQAVTDPNFFLRYDKMEMTFTGQPADVANLTSIDYWSIPMSLKTSKAGKAVSTVKGLLSGVTPQQIFDKLSALTTPPVSGVAGPGGVDGKPLPSLVPGLYKQYPGGPAPAGEFARVIGPSSYPPVYPNCGLPVMPFDVLKDYLQYLHDTFGPNTKVGATVPNLGAGVIARISGEFAGVGPNVPVTGPESRQKYNYTATIDAGLNITLHQSGGSATDVSTDVGAGAASEGHTLLYKYEDLMNPTGIYGGNAPYYLDGSNTPVAPSNDVYGWVGGDLFSGINIGAVGSGVKVGDVAVGSMPSHQWFTLAVGDFFSNLQPEKPYYNQWAKTLADVSEAYNFAYTDRFAHVFASLNPIVADTLTVVLHDAALHVS